MPTDRSSKDNWTQREVDSMRFIQWRLRRDILNQTKPPEEAPEEERKVYEQSMESSH